jgi:hypothetical protein
MVSGTAIRRCGATRVRGLVDDDVDRPWQFTDPTSYQALFYFLVIKPGITILLS